NPPCLGCRSGDLFRCQPYRSQLAGRIPYREGVVPAPPYGLNCCTALLRRLAIPGFVLVYPPVKPAGRHVRSPVPGRGAALHGLRAHIPVFVVDIPRTVLHCLSFDTRHVGFGTATGKNTSAIAEAIAMRAALTQLNRGRSLHV